MQTRSKRFRSAVERVDRSKKYEPAEALGILKGLPAPKFDETVDVVVKLGIDPKKTDQLVRGAVSLPKGLGRAVKVIVFAEGDKAEAATEAGADEVGSDELPDIARDEGMLTLREDGMKKVERGITTPARAQTSSSR